MPNASNTSRVRAAIGGIDGHRRARRDRRPGAPSPERLAVVAPEAAAVGRFRVLEFDWKGAPCVAAGTGYTGEDGSSAPCPPSRPRPSSRPWWPHGAMPRRLGARADTAAARSRPAPSPATSSARASRPPGGLGWVVLGQERVSPAVAALDAERETDPCAGWPARHEGRQPPREGAVILADGQSGERSRAATSRRCSSAASPPVRGHRSRA